MSRDHEPCGVCGRVFCEQDDWCEPFAAGRAHGVAVAVKDIAKLRLEYSTRLSAVGKELAYGNLTGEEAERKAVAFSWVLDVLTRLLQSVGQGTTANSNEE